MKHVNAWKTMTATTGLAYRGKVDDDDAVIRMRFNCERSVDDLIAGIAMGASGVLSERLNPSDNDENDKKRIWALNKLVMTLLEIIDQG